MHEFSIGGRIVETVLAELSRLEPGTQRLCKVRVVVGGLHQIVPDYLRSAYELLARDTPAGGSALEIVLAPVLARCRDCAWEGAIHLPIFRCRRCGSLDVSLSGGRELYLEHLEVEDSHGATTGKRSPPKCPTFS